MTVARARHYPQPPPVSEVLAAETCDHGAVVGRCPLCRRLDAEHADDRDQASSGSAAETRTTETASREEA